MTSYWIKTPPWLKCFSPGKMVWKMPETAKPAVYITFDDGPNPLATPFVLDQLQSFGAKATFFCVGRNVQLHADLYEKILTQGHSVGNHTHDHINGWKNSSSQYLTNVRKAAHYIRSNLFRPPYGRMRYGQYRRLLKDNSALRVYMWDVLSADFDIKISPQQCADNVLANIEPGSIVLFHDSEKAWDRMSYALPQVLAFCKQQNWEMLPLPAY